MGGFLQAAPFNLLVGLYLWVCDFPVSGLARNFFNFFGEVFPVLDILGLSSLFSWPGNPDEY